MSDTVSSDSVAQDQLRAFVERIIRMREEARAIKGDIREIYAEAKGNGFDKTVLGQVVSYAEKKASDPEALAERSMLFDLYLAAFEGRETGAAEDDEETGTPIANAHAHEAAAKPQSPPEFCPPAKTETDRRFGDEDGQSNSPETATQSTAAQKAPPVDTNPAIPSGSHASDDAAPYSAPPPIQESQPGSDVAFPIHAEVAIPLAGAGSDADRQLIPTPADGSDTAEPDSGLGPSMHPEVAPTQLSVLLATASRSEETDWGPDTGAEVVPPYEAGVAADPDKSVGASASPAPGVVTLERCPPNPVHWHDYAKCFPEMFGLALLSLSKDIERNGVRKPIVKIGDAILDGRSRYNMARQLVGEGLIDSYPVVEYDGDDALRDMVCWNLESGRLLTMAERKVIATKLSKLPGNEHRGSEIAEWFGLEVVEKAA